jgi:hypothetical protein
MAVLPYSSLSTPDCPLQPACSLPQEMKLMSVTKTPMQGKRELLWANVVSPVGYILAVSYPVLALSTGVRAIYQLFFRPDITNYLSALAACLYLLAAIGFAYRRPWSWWLSLISLGFESLMTLVVGVWSIVDPEFIGRTVWRHFGADYGYFPLFQPLLGLVWLLWPLTMEAYGIRRKQGETQGGA